MKIRFTLIVIAVFALAIRAQGAPTLSLETGLPIVQGQTRSLALDLSEGEAPYSGVNAQFTLPEGLRLISATRGPLLSDAFTVNWRTYSEGDTNKAVVIVHSGDDTFGADSGTLLKVYVRADVDAAIGEMIVSFDLDATGLSNEAGSQSVLHTTSDGSVMVTVAGTGDPALSVSPVMRDVDRAAGQTTFEVSNPGGGTLTWTSVIASGGDFVDIVNGNGGTNLGTTTVSYTENLTGSPRSATMRFEATGAIGSPVDVVLAQFDCVLPGQPTNLKASDGTFSDHVQLTWDVVAGSSSYAVYRNDIEDPETASRLVIVTATGFDDTTAPSPVVSSGSMECFSSDETTFFTRYYWVRAIDDCGEGPFSASDFGFIGESTKVESRYTQRASATSRFATPFAGELLADSLPMLAMLIFTCFAGRARTRTATRNPRDSNLGFLPRSGFPRK